MVVFKPLGLGITAGEGGLAMAAGYRVALQVVRREQGRQTAEPMPTPVRCNALGVPTMSPTVDGTKYFWFHHSSGRHDGQADPARSWRRCVALMAVTAYVIADMPGYLPRCRSQQGVARVRARFIIGGNLVEQLASEIADAADSFCERVSRCAVKEHAPERSVQRVAPLASSPVTTPARVSPLPEVASPMSPAS